MYENDQIFEQISFNFKKGFDTHFSNAYGYYQLISLRQSKQTKDLNGNVKLSE